MSKSTRGHGSRERCIRHLYRSVFPPSLPHSRSQAARGLRRLHIRPPRASRLGRPGEPADPRGLAGLLILTSLKRLAHFASPHRRPTIEASLPQSFPRVAPLIEAVGKLGNSPAERTETRLVRRSFRCAVAAACCDVSRPLLDGREHDGMLVCAGCKDVSASRHSKLTGDRYPSDECVNRRGFRR